MSDRTKFKTEGSGGKQDGGKKNNFRNNNQPNSNAYYNMSKTKEPETATYIVSQLSLAGQYEILIKEIIRYIIRNLPGRLHLGCGMCDDKLPNMFLDPNTKQEKNPDGKSAVDDNKYNIQVLEWKENMRI